MYVVVKRVHAKPGPACGLNPRRGRLVYCRSQFLARMDRHGFHAPSSSYTLGLPLIGATSR